MNRFRCAGICPGSMKSNDARAEHLTAECVGQASLGVCSKRAGFALSWSFQLSHMRHGCACAFESAPPAASSAIVKMQHNSQPVFHSRHLFRVSFLMFPESSVHCPTIFLLQHRAHPGVMRTALKNCMAAGQVELCAEFPAGDEEHCEARLCSARIGHAAKRASGGRTVSECATKFVLKAVVAMIGPCRYALADQRLIELMKLGEGTCGR